MLALNPFDRLFQMGRIIASYDIPATEFWKKFPHDYWPVAFIKSNGRINVCEYKNGLKRNLFGYPIPLKNEELYNVFKSDKYSGFVQNYNATQLLPQSAAKAP